MLRFVYAKVFWDNRDNVWTGNDYAQVQNKSVGERKPPKVTVSGSSGRRAAVKRASVIVPNGERVLHRRLSTMQPSVEGVSFRRCVGRFKQPGEVCVSDEPDE